MFPFPVSVISESLGNIVFKLVAVDSLRFAVEKN